MNVCEAWCCCCGEIWSKRVLPLRRKLVKEKEGAWRRRIYRKYASCKWLKEAGLEFTRADVVVSISRGPPGQWFLETEHWASAIFVGTSGIPPKIIYRSVKSYKSTKETRTLLSRLVLSEKEAPRKRTNPKNWLQKELWHKITKKDILSLTKVKLTIGVWQHCFEQVSRYISSYSSPFFVITLSLFECMLFLLPYSMFSTSIREDVPSRIL